MQDGVSWWVMIFYIFMIVFVSFFAVNLMLAVLYVKFTEPSAVEDDEVNLRYMFLVAPL